MRLIATLLMFAALVFTTARAEVSGAYATPAAERADDCIKVCQDDTLCVGWTYEAGACGLWASVPKQAPSAFTFGSRAPGFAQDMPVTTIAQAAAPAPPPAPPRREPAAVALLGGDTRSEDLRPRFGAGN
jgi:hypothetical protein